MKQHTDHLFRPTRPPAGGIAALKTRFAAQHAKAYRRFVEYYADKHVIEDALTERLLGKEPFDRKYRAAAAALHKSFGDRVIPRVRDQKLPGPPVFEMKPGLNVLGPPYDVGLVVALGSNTPAVVTSTANGAFDVMATATAGTNTYGSAGVALFIVPSDPKRTLSIRPYFQWHYYYSCESHGTPTAHSTGVIGADVSGHGGAGTNFPGKSMQLWSAGSDFWDDASGDDSDVFRIPDSELVVSGNEWYTVSYVCQASADAHKSGFGYSISYVQLHCRVPFLVVEEF